MYPASSASQQQNRSKKGDWVRRRSPRSKRSSLTSTAMPRYRRQRQSVLTAASSQSHRTALARSRAQRHAYANLLRPMRHLGDYPVDPERSQDQAQCGKTFPPASRRIVAVKLRDPQSAVSVGTQPLIDWGGEDSFWRGLATLLQSSRASIKMTQERQRHASPGMTWNL
jgi:hypothetical protein